MSHSISSQHVSDLQRSSKYGRNAKVEGEPIYDNPESRQRYEAYSRLQAGAVAFGEKLPIPEIVAIGGQSDGKSSLLEALLGFRFNVREVEMGTRRPLVLQMAHDPTAIEPRCRLQDEDSDDYGPPIEPPTAVAESVRSRTEAHLKKLGNGAVVSSKPIVMRAEYAYSPNLTIIDSPGFVLNSRKGEPENTPESIMNMVKALIAPQNRLILFLQQSSVEWVSSLWLDVIKEIDPSFRRTVIVSSKFDNRLKEFAERWEVDRYLSANGVLGDGVKPFFVALPKDRSIQNNTDFRRQIAAVDSEILRQLREGISGGFDEERFGGQIGFGNLRRFLEQELQRRYRDAAPSTLALLERRCSELDEELAQAESRLATAGDVAGLRKISMIYAASVSRHLVALIDGSADPDPEAWGRTSEEEREESGVGKWPGVSVDPKPANGSLRLYGGAAFERVLDEFRCAACSLECPFVSREKVANILLAHSGKQGGPLTAALEIARQSARVILAPLLDALCDRLAYVLRWLFDVALHRLKLEIDSIPGSTESRLALSTLDAYVAFHACLRRAHHRFVSELTSLCKDRARHHLTTATCPFSAAEAWELNLSFPQVAHFGELHGPEGEQSVPHGYALNLDSVTPPQRNSLEEGENARAAPKSSNNISNSNNNNNNYSNGNGNGGGSSSSPDDGLEQLRESLTVPETPSPEQGVNDQNQGRRREHLRTHLVNGQVMSGTSGGTVGSGDLNGILKRFNAVGVNGNLEGNPQNPGAQKKRGGIQGIPGPGGRALLGGSRVPPRTMAPGGKSLYSDVVALVAEHFSRIREILVNRMVPSTLSSGFLTPCREKLSTAVSVELFASTDDEFMEMFVAPGALETLRTHKDALEKRSQILQNCAREFRTLARSL